MQNLLIQYGYGLLDAMTMNLLNQTKTMFAAVFLFLLLGRRQSNVQVVALTMLLAAAMVLTSAPDSGGEGEGEGEGAALGWLRHLSLAAVSGKVRGVLDGFSMGNWGNWSSWGSDYTLALGAMLGASLLSGLSSAATQVALQARQRNSMVYTAEMALVSIPLLLLGDLYTGAGTSSLLSTSIANGWTWQTWIPVLSNASGGLVVGLVMQHAGSITKGFALIAGILVTAVTEYALGSGDLGWRHAAATALVCVSIFLHTSFPYVSPASPAAVAKKRD
jgi:UDP-sugar transporter A1/2/3